MSEFEASDVRGSRLDGNKTKVQLLKNGQFKTTIPRAFALGLGLENGSVLNWELTQRGILLKRGGKDDGN